MAIDIRPLMDPVRAGVGEYTYELLNALFKIDKQNQYFLFYNSAKDVSKYIPKWEQDNVHYIGLKFPNKLFNMLLLFKLFHLDSLIERNWKLAPQQVTGSRLNSGKTGNLDYWFSPNINFTSISKNCKHILTIHDLSFEYFRDCYCLKRRLWHKILNPKKACQKADIILTPSENTKQDIIDKYKIKLEKVRVIYPGYSQKYQLPITNYKGTLIPTLRRDQLPIKQKYNLPEKFILFLGTIEPRKNIIGIIEAFKKFHNLQPTSYKLIIAGAKGWEFEPVMNLINKSDNIQYIGYVEAEDKSELYKMADLFIYPSLYEGFGFPILEAMAAGTPVITSNRSSMPEVSGGAAYLVNPNNVSEIARAMELILKDECIRDSFVEKGKIQAKQFHWNKTAKEFLNLIR